MEQTKKSSYWTKKELEILEKNFPSVKWEDLLEMLPKKTVRQIENKADNLGLDRTEEAAEEYYDEIQEAWVVTSKNRGNKVSLVFPAKEGMTLEEAKKRVTDNIAKVLSEFLVDRMNKEKE